MIHEMSSPTQIHLYVAQINSIRLYFIGTIELIICLEFLKTDLKLRFRKLKVLNFGNLEFFK